MREMSDILKERMLRTIHGVCDHAYEDRKPTADYVERAVRLLVGTGCVESGFERTRQIGYDFWAEGGAFGYYQMEVGAIELAMEYLHRHPKMADRMGFLVWGSSGMYSNWEVSVTPGEVARWMTFSGTFTFQTMMARVFYLTRPGEIPVTDESRGGYWKTHWNTEAGSGRVATYMVSLSRFDSKGAIE